jgi:lysophospholipid hydrolase
MIASRVRDEVDSSSGVQSRNGASELGYDNTNLKTVAVLPMSRNVPIDAFARKLYAALESIGASTSYLNQASVASHLGRHAFSRMGKLKAAGWLADQEQRYRTVLYVADSPVNSSWTQTCIRQASKFSLSTMSIMIAFRLIGSWWLAWVMILAWVNMNGYYFL